ncbi:acyltransferase [Amycolatopsis magusensis]|uniref:Acetyltransferase-like isoleucine patch superfamily enzyme n=1 Tax=Amycolatopsis magusensis TaxID=882444 RepID=A0ABS4PJC8_9PSEU|nr:acyltransferase [Amycolatopsis magusensis]MBP2179527.1 acetyltransferase-like isoleucine patch superfamily enzyme [Amycolatopsis magusensis]MDI5979409.1 acyltransferase [Amycolatopsis magusensis]
MFFDDERSNRLRPQILTELVGEYMNDAERAKLFGLPETTRIRQRAKIVSPDNLKMGEHCWIGEGAILDASGGMEIGEHTSIGVNTLIFTHSSWLANMTLQNHSGSDLIERKPVKIGKGCFIGGLVVIMAGVTIGDFATVQPNSVVAKDVPARSLVAGNPARVFQRYDDEHIENEVKRVREDNERRRKLAEERGMATGPWGAPAGDFSEPKE